MVQVTGKPSAFTAACCVVSFEGLFLEITKKYYIVDRKNISYLKFIFEACEGIAIITTIDPGSGLVLFRIPPGCENDVETVIQGLKKEIMIEEYMPDIKDGLKEGNEHEVPLY